MTRREVVGQLHDRGDALATAVASPTTVSAAASRWLMRPTAITLRRAGAAASGSGALLGAASRRPASLVRALHAADEERNGQATACLSRPALDGDQDWAAKAKRRRSRPLRKPHFSPSIVAQATDDARRDSGQALCVALVVAYGSLAHRLVARRITTSKP